MMQASTHIMQTMSYLKHVLHDFSFSPCGSNATDAEKPIPQACVNSPEV